MMLFLDIFPLRFVLACDMRFIFVMGFGFGKGFEIWWGCSISIQGDDDDYYYYLLVLELIFSLHPWGPHVP